MESSLEIGTINQVGSDTTIYHEGEEVKSVALLLRGKATSYNNAIKMNLNPGDFIAVQDLYIGNYTCTTTTDTDCIFFVFEATSMEDVERILELKKEYKGYMIKSLNRSVIHMYDTYYAIVACGNETLDKATLIMQEFKALVQLDGNQVLPVPGIEALEVCNKKLLVEEQWMDRVREEVAIPIELVVQYFSYIPNIALAEIHSKLMAVNAMMKQMKELISFTSNIRTNLFHTSNVSVFKSICETLGQLSPTHANYYKVVEYLDQIVCVIRNMDNELENLTDQNKETHREQMELLYTAALQGKETSQDELDAQETEEHIEAVCKNSLEQIIAYAQMESEFNDSFIKYMNEFAGLRDKQSKHELVSQLRRNLTPLFFELYGKVFEKAHRLGTFDKVIELFLNFGFVDERLLTKKQLIELYRLKVRGNTTHYCQCYTLYEWLVAIYEGRKEPSKNEMDEDYRDYVRQQVRVNKLTEREEKQRLTDQEAKVVFELEHMIVQNWKLTNGKISTFVPFLYEEVMPFNMEKEYLSPVKLDEVLRDLLQIDFSVFYREVIYTNPRVGIQREQVMKECVPDLILLPTSGMNGVMWQETADKLRDSAGRFCLPILNQGNLQDMMIRLLGRYRWELCRTLQGLSWNDIKNKCLTSEYSDYIQSYRKNKELSEEKREKVKQQIVKSRNNTKECFVMDYEQWMKYEVNGSNRLNKCARDIMAHYCPFSKEIRRQLSDKAQYAEGFGKYEYEVKAKARVLDAKILGISKGRFEIPKELEFTSAYYHNK